MNIFKAFFLTMCMIWALNLDAMEKIYSFDDSNQQIVFENLLEELRCLVCQNQSLADSASGLATDLRDEVYQMVLENKTEEVIKIFLVERYGNFVLYDPPLNTSTTVLWFAPFLLALLAVGLVLFLSRRQKVD